MYIKCISWLVFVFIFFSFFSVFKKDDIHLNQRINILIKIFNTWTANEHFTYSVVNLSTLPVLGYGVEFGELGVPGTPWIGTPFDNIPSFLEFISPLINLSSLSTQASWYSWIHLESRPIWMSISALIISYLIIGTLTEPHWSNICL